MTTTPTTSHHHVDRDTTTTTSEDVEGLTMPLRRADSPDVPAR
jgi:hypothetical protein